MSQNDCQHSKISQTIANMVMIALITATGVTVNLFHFPLHFHGIEMERFELGFIVILLLVNKVATRNLIIASLLLTFVDQLQHGHSLVILPFEIIFNILFLTIFTILHRFNRYQNQWNKIGSFFGCLVCTIVLKGIYFGTVLYIFVPEASIFNLINNKEKFINNSLVLAIYTMLVTIKFTIILGVGIHFNKKIHR